jgi:flagellar biosynthesis protein FlhB
MYFIYSELFFLAHFFFAVAIISFAISLLISLNKINLSTKAIELELSDIEGLENPSVIEYIKKKFEKEQTISD